ncbi:hypothetical protein [Pseudogemmobacter bohemicus]|uniref:hypothetical protein n=1 Tax=Pseudogemmobacter bohemicus TaxID=2250708 RepID=UPI0013007603|nr:hypothetical protein [Pseudogemmobacter bohemicus]
MLYAVAGSQLYIGQPSDWLLIRSAESLGSPGVSWATVDVTYVGSEHVEMIRGPMAPRSMQIVLAVDSDDPGQAALWQAAHGSGIAGFRLVLSDGAAWREWEALIIGIGEAFDAANSVVRLLVDLQINSKIRKSEAAP